MPEMLAVSREEYESLCDIQKLSFALSYKQPDPDDEEIIDMLAKYGRAHYQTFGSNYPEVINPPPIEPGEGSIEEARNVAHGLMNIGMNGPRHGGIPTITGNLMCKGARVIEMLLAKSEGGE